MSQLRAREGGRTHERNGGHAQPLRDFCVHFEQRVIVLRAFKAEVPHACFLEVDGHAVLARGVVVAEQVARVLGSKGGGPRR